MAGNNNPETDGLTILLDWDIIDGCNGFTFDIGGSMLKLAYISPANWVDPQHRKQGTKGKVSLKSFPREEIDKAYDFINTQVRRKQDDPEGDVSIYSTGVGGSQFQKDIKHKLNVKNLQLAEFDCFIQSFVYVLKNIPRRDALEPIDPEAFKFAHKEYAGFLEVLPNMKFLGTDLNLDPPVYPQEQVKWKPDLPLVQDSTMFPCAMVMTGSAFGIFLVNEDGTYKILDGSHRGGRMFLGLGALLTGAESFDELMSLCERGRLRGVSQMTSDLWEQDTEEPKQGTGEVQNGHVEENGGESKQEVTGQTGEEEEDLYKSWIKNPSSEDDGNMVFGFGKAVGKKAENFRKEDLARSLLEVMVQDMVQTIHLVVKQHNVRHAFLCGGFTSHPLSRSLIMKEWLKRDTMQNVLRPNKVGLIQAHFLVHGQFLGSIGALMNHKLRWSDKL